MTLYKLIDINIGVKFQPNKYLCIVEEEHLDSMKSQ